MWRPLGMSNFATLNGRVPSVDFGYFTMGRTTSECMGLVGQGASGVLHLPPTDPVSCNKPAFVR